MPAPSGKGLIDPIKLSPLPSSPPRGWTLAIRDLILSSKWLFNNKHPIAWKLIELMKNGPAIERRGAEGGAEGDERRRGIPSQTTRSFRLVMISNP